MAGLKFYNSLTRKVEPFSPYRNDMVRVYHCGPTVYKRQHIGNMRRFLFADFLRRTLELYDYTVREVTNITDVGHLTEDELDAGEDKMEVAARESRRTPQDIADQQTALFHSDLAALNIQESWLYPRASEHVAEMKQMIGQLIDRGYAYITSTGVYFDVTSFPAYGALSGNTPDSIAAGHRVDVREEKRHPADFALWVIDDRHLQKWDSPWGTGYPGWHIECSAMSLAHLGDHIDIHTGGEDNRFPHHENEIAQAEGSTGEPFVRFWMHNRHLQLSGQKLAKRHGEQITLDTLRDRGYSLLAFRLFVFSSHYRSPMNFSWEALDDAARTLSGFESLVRRLRDVRSTVTAMVAPDETVVSAFKEALAVDLNTPEALAEVLNYVRSSNTELERDAAGAADEVWATLLVLDQVLGLFTELDHEIECEVVPADVRDLAEQRDRAREAKNFDLADSLREQVEGKGFVIEDTAAGPRIRSA